MKTILMGLGAILKEKLAHPDRADILALKMLMAWSEVNQTIGSLRGA